MAIIRRDKKEATRILRFAIVGILNTIITYIIYVVMRWMDFPPGLSNAVGYIAALINSFIWNKLWVFEMRHTNVWREIFYFCMAFLLAYGSQYAFFKTMIDCVGLNEYLVQFLGLFIYGAVNFVMNRVLTFKNR